MIRIFISNQGNHPLSLGKYSSATQIELKKEPAAKCFLFRNRLCNLKIVSMNQTGTGVQWTKTSALRSTGLPRDWRITMRTQSVLGSVSGRRRILRLPITVPSPAWTKPLAVRRYTSKILYPLAETQILPQHNAADLLHPIQLAVQEYIHHPQTNSLGYLLPALRLMLRLTACLRCSQQKSSARRSWKIPCGYGTPNGF